MKIFSKFIKLLTILIVLSLLSCQQSKNENEVQSDLLPEKEAILNTLNNETKAAFERDYEVWAQYWIHDTYTSKTYINFSDNSHSESLGWQAIGGFVKSFMSKYPDPEPVPKPIDNIELRLYANGAWVSYSQVDSLRGRKREVRFLEKVHGDWKIAHMHTTIY